MPDGEKIVLLSRKPPILATTREPKQRLRQHHVDAAGGLYTPLPPGLRTVVVARRLDRAIDSTRITALRATRRSSKTFTAVSNCGSWRVMVCALDCRGHTNERRCCYLPWPKPAERTEASLRVWRAPWCLSRSLGLTTGRQAGAGVTILVTVLASLLAASRLVG